jgi:hypothetical protein
MTASRTAVLRSVPTAEWDELVRRLGGVDTYPSAAYSRVSAELEAPGTVPVLLHHVHADGEIALPLLLRPLPDGAGWDATSAYGYGGPVARGGPAPDFGRALDDWARENGVVTTFLRLHPLLGNAPLVPTTAELVPLGPTVGWDVTAGRDLRALLHPHHRRAVRSAERAGVQVDVVRPRSLDEFRALYDATMRRQHAADFYFFPDAYWTALLDAADPLGVVLVEARLDGALVAALLCFGDGPWLHYHLGASDDVARRVGASTRCFLAAAEWAQARGMSRFHLGGGLGADPDSSLLTFKRRFDPSTELLPFSVAKLVHDRETYARLAGTVSTAGYFPPWRRAG